MIFNLEPLGGAGKHTGELPLLHPKFKEWSLTYLLAEVQRRELLHDYKRADELREALFSVTTGTQYKP